MAAILSVARKQYSLLKAANLLTPDMVSEFEELERLVQQEAGASLEQAPLPNGHADAQGTQQGCDSKDLGQLVLSPLLFLGAQHVLEGCFGGDACGRVRAAPSRGHRPRAEFPPDTVPGGELREQLPALLPSVSGQPASLAARGTVGAVSSPCPGGVQHVCTSQLKRERYFCPQD